MTNKKMTKDDRVGMWVARIACLVIAIVFILFGLVFKQPCDIDAIYLSCRLTGSFGDWLGCIMFFGGLVLMSGIVPSTRDWTNAPNSSALGIGLFVLMVIGIVLLWNL